MIAAVKAESLNGKVTKATVAIALTLGFNSFRCQARNLAGSSESTAAVNVTTKGKPSYDIKKERRRERKKEGRSKKREGT